MVSFLAFALRTGRDATRLSFEGCEPQLAQALNGSGLCGELRAMHVQRDPVCNIFKLVGHEGVCGLNKLCMVKRSPNESCTSRSSEKPLATS